MLGRIVIDDVRPRTPDGFPAKAVVGQSVRISADIFRDGHDILAARVRWRAAGDEKWSHAPMSPAINDRWYATVQPGALGAHEFVVEAWTDLYETWRHKLEAKLGAGQDVGLELLEGAQLIEERLRVASGPEVSPLRSGLDVLAKPRSSVQKKAAALTGPDVASVMTGLSPGQPVTATDPFPLWVDRERALFSTWYEVFPRSEGGFSGLGNRLPAIADMGFDVLYLPPIHPIGRSHRKGKNNSLISEASDPGSPWAIGSAGGGHTAIHEELGNLTDFEMLVERAGRLGLEIALDYALQCSPDHPWVKEHPSWFHHRPDGSIAYAENPPKKYQDIYPINFWPEDEVDRQTLWDACKEVLDYWIDKGVRIFRVDNPHTKPLVFWSWLLEAVRSEHPEVIFLSEAFTAPKMMAKLAEIGFSQSYTYFTWRTFRDELADYVQEVHYSPVADYMRPNFWPNTPDILSGPLRNGPPSAFKIRVVLAATMVPSYGIYSGYELCENAPASDTNEEYLNSEKYEIKHRDWDSKSSLAPMIARLNDARRRHAALQQLGNVHVQHATNDAVLAYARVTDDRSDVVLTVVNLDPWNVHESGLVLDLANLGLPWDAPFEAYDELTGNSWTWQGAEPYIRLDPHSEPAHVLHLRSAT